MPTNKQQGISDVATTVGEMLSAADAIKGAVFSNATAGVFELLQASQLLGVIDATASLGGVNVTSLINQVVTVLSAASARLVVGLSESDRSDSMALARQMADRVSTSIKNALRGD